MKSGGDCGHVCEQYRVIASGRIDEINEQLFAITTERRLNHPAIVAISQSARDEVFGNTGHDQQPESGARKSTLLMRSYVAPALLRRFASTGPT